MSSSIRLGGIQSLLFGYENRLDSFQHGPNKNVESGLVAVLPATYSRIDCRKETLLRASVIAVNSVVLIHSGLWTPDSLLVVRIVASPRFRKEKASWRDVAEFQSVTQKRLRQLVGESRLSRILQNAYSTT